ncbi:MAG: tRNA (adenosine(37)-N6)-threonylcarbamoyltransferase complex ATPase subunit type 1 TsaE [Epsilonproteobacteria bacterium]|nr:tRNA (adenosine(37)-N6)-threonylcarbamoyltransferase complex ATPase subunit type 1 TsaE [Campylobacterota bacterium]
MANLKKEVFICGISEVADIALHLQEIIQNKNMVVLLRGDLASGKTTFVKSFVAIIGCDDLVTSPTFSLQSCYDKNIFHYDMYNKTLGEFISLGMVEEFEKDGVHFVEWGDETLEKLLDEYGFQYITITIKKLDEMREYTIEL